MIRPWRRIKISNDVIRNITQSAKIVLQCLNNNIEDPFFNLKFRTLYHTSLTTSRHSSVRKMRKYLMRKNKATNDGMFCREL